jgi:hypothetical protein
MTNADRFILAVILGIIMMCVFIIERRVALLNNTISLRDSTILRIQKYEEFSDSIMWSHIEHTDSMHIEAIRQIMNH